VVSRRPALPRQAVGEHPDCAAIVSIGRRVSLAGDVGRAFANSPVLEVISPSCEEAQELVHAGRQTPETPPWLRTALAVLGPGARSLSHPERASSMPDPVLHAPRSCASGRATYTTRECGSGSVYCPPVHVHRLLAAGRICTSVVWLSATVDAPPRTPPPTTAWPAPGLTPV